MRRRHFLATATVAGVPIRVFAEEKRPIRIGQIGTGHAHASGKMDVYRASSDFDVIGIAEPDDDLWENASKRKTYQGISRMSVDELLAADGLQAVAVETRVGDLLKYAELAVDAGFHVHLDKPAGEDFGRYRKIMKKADEKKLTVQMGYMYRFNPAVQLLQKFLREKWLGEIFEVHAVMSKVVSGGARKGLAKFEGGIMFELGCHIIDLAVSVLGKPDKVTPHFRKHGKDGLIDNMLAVFDYKNAVATVKSSAIEVEGFSRRHLVVCGTKGTFHIQPLDRPKVTLSLSHDCGGAYRKGTQTIPFEPPYRRYVGDAADLAAIIRGEKESGYPSTHDLAVQETVLRASGLPV